VTPGEPERLAIALREAHPDAEPLELDPDLLSEWIADAGADPSDERLMTATLVAWEGLL